MSGSGTPDGEVDESRFWQTALAGVTNGISPRHVNTHSASPNALQHNNSKRPTEWRSYSFLEVHIADLPKNVTTYEIFENFSRYGNIDQIQIRADNQNSELKRADVRFRPPPTTAFWGSRRRHNFFRETQRESTTVYVTLSKSQLKDFTHESQLKKGVVYHDEMVMISDLIEFGVLLDPKCFLSKRTLISKPTKSVSLTLRLHRNEITIRFPLEFTSESGTLVRDFRFVASLDQALSITKIDGIDQAFSLILHLESPPRYSKRVIDPRLQHDDDATLWREDDMWLRQTDLALRKSDIFQIRRSAVTLTPSPLNIVALGRWTTFRFKFSGTSENSNTFRVFSEAIKERNTKVTSVNDFKDAGDTEALWKVLEKLAQPDSTLSQWEQNFQRVELPFSVRYQLEVCISNGWLNEYNLGEHFVRELSRLDERVACRILENVANCRKKCFDLRKILSSAALKMPKRRTRILDYCVLMHSATITATTVRVNTPSVELSNRVVRQYQQHSDRFLRIRFEDDEYRGSSRIYAETSKKMNELFVRIKRTLLKGVFVAGRHYEFLAWGNSQLREHGAYFFASLSGTVTASQIRAVLGQFDHEKIIAKRAARIGQCFSTTKSISGRIERVTEHDLIDDITRNGYTFTDGVGKISPLLAAQAAAQLKINGDPPSVFQIRLGGCKGILALAPDLKGRSVQIRKSQFKFPCESDELEIIRSSEFWNAYLNRQLILVLSALGVPASTFLDMQKAEIEALNRALTSDRAALQALYERVDPNRMTPVIATLVSNGFRSSREPFVTSLLHLWRAWTLKYLKEKAHLKVADGALILGCVDERAILQGHFDNRQPGLDATEEEKEKALPEIFVQITLPETGERKIIKGKCIVARNPSLHIGDIRVVMAVDKPALHHLRDVLVLPQTGDRDLSSMCSGGDLDGDDYIVIWDEKLLPPNWTAKPFHYRSPEPVRAIGEVTQNDFVNFFHQYIKNDFLGKIATAHLAWADYADDGIESEECLELTNLHSMAVDYPKTGVPAKLPRRLERGEKPHFMEKPGKSHRSHKVLGLLFDGVQKVAFTPKYEYSFDDRILESHQPSQSLLRAAAELKEDYDESIRRIMAQHDIKTEFEVWSTFVMSHSKATNDFKFHEEIGQLSRNLKDQFYQAIVERVGSRDHDSLAPFAVAAYQLVADQLREAKMVANENGEAFTTNNMPLISFPWVLHEVLGKIVGTVSDVDPTDLDVLSRSEHHGFADGLANGDLPSTTFEHPRISRIGNRYPDPFQPKMEAKATPMTSGGGTNDVQSSPQSSCKDWEVRGLSISALLSSNLPGRPITAKNGTAVGERPAGGIGSKLPALITQNLPDSPSTLLDDQSPFWTPSSSEEQEDNPRDPGKTYLSTADPDQVRVTKTPSMTSVGKLHFTEGKIYSDPAADDELLARLLAANLDD